MRWSEAAAGDCNCDCEGWGESRMVTWLGTDGEVGEVGEASSAVADRGGKVELEPCMAESGCA